MSQGCRRQFYDEPIRIPSVVTPVRIGIERRGETKYCTGTDGRKKGAEGPYNLTDVDQQTKGE